MEAIQDFVGIWATVSKASNPKWEAGKGSFDSRTKGFQVYLQLRIQDFLQLLCCAASVRRALCKHCEKISEGSIQSNSGDSSKNNATPELPL